MLMAWGPVTDRVLGVRPMHLGELQQRLGLPNRMAGLRRGAASGGSNGSPAAMDQDAAPGAAPAAAGGDAAEAVDGEAAVKAEGFSRVSPAEGEAVAEAAAGADGDSDEEAVGEAGLRPVYELYEALLRVLLLV